MEQIENWLNAIKPAGLPSGSQPILLPTIIVLVVIVVLIIAFLVFGVPRLNRRRRAARALFGEDDERSAKDLRASARAAAEQGDFATAIEEQFRAIARDLEERTVILAFPGTTAHGFAVQASVAFPDRAPRLGDAADTFDRVRYLGAAGTEEEWRAIVALDADLTSTRPVLADQLSGGRGA